MPIAVTCKCGSRFAAKDELAGKRLACPSCKQPLDIPQAVPTAKPAAAARPAAATRPVTAARPAQGAAPARPAAAPAATSVVVACRCGQRFQAASFLFGKTVNCPTCKSQLTVPVPTAKPVAPRPAPLAPAVNPLDPLGGGGFGGLPADNDPFGVGIMNSATPTLPSVPLSNYPTYTAPAVSKPAPAKKKKSSSASGKKWALTGSGIAAAILVVFVALGILGRIARVARFAGLNRFTQALTSGKVEWVPHVSPTDGYSVEIVKHKPGVNVPGIAGTAGPGGVVAASSPAGPCTIVACQRLPMALDDAQGAIALGAWENSLNSMISANRGRIISTASCTLGGMAGREVVVEHEENGGTTVTQFQVAFKGDRVYILGFLATKPIYNASDAARFFSSFRLTGNSIGAPAAAPSFPTAASAPAATEDNAAAQWHLL